MSGMVLVVTGPIAFGLGSELVIAHPDAVTTPTLVVLHFAGPLLHLLTQTW